MPVGLSYFQRRRIFQPHIKKNKKNKNKNKNKKKTTGSKPKVLELEMSPHSKGSLELFFVRL